MQWSLAFQYYIWVWELVSRVKFAKQRAVCCPPCRRRKSRSLQCVGSDLSLSPAMCSATTHAIISLPKPLHNASTRKTSSASN